MTYLPLPARGVLIVVAAVVAFTVGPLVEYVQERHRQHQLAREVDDG